MNNEIKEILESSRKIIKSNRENDFDRIIMLCSDIEKLEDYITNLQEKLEEQKRIEKESLDKILDLEDTIVDKKECIKALEISFTNLQEENDRLAIELNKQMIERNQFLSRIDKAIDYIGNPLDNYWQEESRHLLDILKGDN